MISVRIKEGYKPKNQWGNPDFTGELFSIEDSGCWVLLPDQCTNVAFAPYELSLSAETTKADLRELVDDDCEPDYAKKTITQLLRHRRKS